MGLIGKVASIMMLGGVSSHTRREPPGNAEQARTKAERAREEAAQAQAVRVEAEAKVAEEQAAALAWALARGRGAPASGPEGGRRERGRGRAGVATRPLTAARRAGAHLDGMGRDVEGPAGVLAHGADVRRGSACDGGRCRAGVVPRGGPGRLGRHRLDAAVVGRERGWPSTALSTSARSAPAWSCPITGPAGATTPERTSGT
jgi:hypothetical protein